MIHPNGNQKIPLFGGILVLRFRLPVEDLSCLVDWLGLYPVAGLVVKDGRLFCRPLAYGRHHGYQGTASGLAATV